TSGSSGRPSSRSSAAERQDRHMTNRAKKRIALLLAILVLGVGGLFIFKSVREAQRTALIEKRRDSGVAARAAGDHLTVVNDLGFALIAAPDAGVEIDPELWLDW